MFDSPLALETTNIASVKFCKSPRWCALILFGCYIWELASTMVVFSCLELKDWSKNAPAEVLKLLKKKKTHIFFWIYMYMYDFIILPWLNSKSLIDNCFNPSEKIEFVTFTKPTFIHHLSTFKRFCTTTLHCCGMWFLRTLITCIKHRNLRLSSEHDKTNKVWWHLKSIIDVGEN